MAATITLIIILILSFLITRIATIALTHTGLSRATAKFQARSAFTGVGFTTNESEKVVNNPVRRRILLILMILGNAGIVTGISTLIISFTGIENSRSAWMKLAILVSFIIILWIVANSKWVEIKLANLISRFLKKYTRLDVNDYASLLNLGGDFRISEIAVEENHWLLGKKIKESKLRDEGIIILAITRMDGTFLGAPQASTEIHQQDSIIVYGRATSLDNLQNRIEGRMGQIEHKKSVQEQKEVVEEEKKKAEE